MGALVVPLINVLRDELLTRLYLLMDETTVQVLKEPGKAAESKSQLWAQMSAGPEPPIVLFEYDPTPFGRGGPNGCSKGSPERCTATATAATCRRCARTTSCTWPVGRMRGAISSMR